MEKKILHDTFTVMQLMKISSDNGVSGQWNKVTDNSEVRWEIVDLFHL